jgi:hypothetical protein
VQQFIDKFKRMIHPSGDGKGFSFNDYYFKPVGGKWYVSWEKVPGAQGTLAKMLRSLGGDEVRSMLASTDRVLARKAGIENGKLDSKLKRLANAYMFQDGLDGNGRFRKATDGYNLALKILGDFGIELGEIVSSHLFSPDSNTLKIDLAFTNPADSFSPVSITNSMLHLSYTRLDNDRFEVLAYLT